MGTANWSKDGIDLYLGDCREIIGSLPVCNAAITDPPYNSMDEHGARGKTTRLAQFGHKTGGGVHWFNTLTTGEIVDVVRAIPMFDSGAAYVFTDSKTASDMFHLLRQRNIIVWDKGRIGMGYNWRRMHELVAFCPGVKHKLRRKDFGDIQREPPVKNKVHPTEKPVALIGRFIINSTDVDHLVIDPFMGSGTTGVACVLNKRRFIGIEIDPKSFDIAVDRIETALRDNPRSSAALQEYMAL